MEYDANDAIIDEFSSKADLKTRKQANSTQIYSFLFFNTFKIGFIYEPVYWNRFEFFKRVYPP